MKREFLEKLGLEKDVIDQIMAENGKDIESKKKELEEASEAKKKAEEMLAERDKQIETLSKSKGNAEELQAEIEKLKTANQEAAEKHQNELKEIKINNAVESALLSANARNLKATKALLDMGAISLNDSGEIIGIKEQVEKLIKAEESKFMFGEGSFEGAKPPEGSGKPPTSKKPSEMTFEEYQAAFEAGQIK